jgi:hypothetical protein
MKRPATLAFTLATLLGLRLFSLAAEPQKGDDAQRAELEKLGGFEPMPPGPEDYNLHCEVLMVALPEADALALLPQLRDPQKIEKALVTIQEMLAAQKAKFVGWPSIVTRSGNRAVTENIDEVRYPIEYAGPSVQVLPAEAAADAPRPQKAPAAPSAPEPAAPAPSDAQIVKPEDAPKLPETLPPTPPKPQDPGKPTDPIHPIVIDASSFDPVPTTFETKNVGITFEIEPTLDTRTMTIEMNLAPQHVFFAGMVRHVVETKDRKVAVEQPRFRTNKVQTNVSLRSGKAVLLEQFKSGEFPGWIELFILRATARPVK